MDYSLKVRNNWKSKHSKRIEKKIFILLKKIPQNYLIGISSIELFDKIPVGKKNIGGLYIPRTQREPAKIQIAVGSVLGNMPRFMFYFPFIIDFLLGQVLYHEIGHHNTLLKTKRKKSHLEDDAEKFSNKMLKKVFFKWLVFFSPMYKIFNAFKNKTNSKDNRT